MRVLVMGGSGVVGRPLIRALRQRGHEVTATTHRPENLAALEAMGARPALVDGLDEAAVRESVLDAVPEVIVNQVTALATPARDYGTWLQATNRLRSRGTEILMRVAREAGARRVVAQSASFMTTPDGAGPTDESSPLYWQAPEPLKSHVEANHSAEKLVRSTPGIDGVVLRYGFLYGDGTAIGPSGDITTAVTAREMPVVGDGSGRYPFIHVSDAVAVTAQAVDKGSPGIYNIVDDEPAAQAEWLPYLAALLDAPMPPRMSEADAIRELGVQAVYYGNQLRAASNHAAKAELGLSLQYPSWRAGFRSVFNPP